MTRFLPAVELSAAISPQVNDAMPLIACGMCGGGEAAAAHPTFFSRNVRHFDRREKSHLSTRYM